MTWWVEYDCAVRRSFDIQHRSSVSGFGGHGLSPRHSYRRRLSISRFQGKALTSHVNGEVMIIRIMKVTRLGRTFLGGYKAGKKAKQRSCVKYQQVDMQ